MHILTINAGSSSLKIKLFQLTKSKNEPLLLLSGIINNLFSSQSNFNLYNSSGKSIFCQHCNLNSEPYLNALELVLDCSEFKQFKLDAVIHRIVHGGDIYSDIVQLDDAIISKLTKFNDFAPLHQPYSLLIVNELRKNLPPLPHYACFDTAFHQTIPLINRIYAIPWHYTQAGIKKYGFHGLSYNYISSALVNIVGDQHASAQWIIAHLGSGSSLCAIKNGKSVATTMGFSCLDGLPMMTRCGELDAQIPLFLQQEYMLSPVEVLHILNNESGLYGICQSKDMQEILDNNTPQAKLAVELYCKYVASNIAKLAVDLGGLAGIVFTGGIGENSNVIREKICTSLQWLFVLKIDSDKNINNQVMIQAKKSKIQVLVMQTDEELLMVSQFVNQYT